ncbi:MAG TPA: helix-turn-helix domain-containing protein [Vicinamibacteria bacterium]|nr:helix-turn-helix domain-containing protein [Vicinamibacteria bacterium]
MSTPVETVTGVPVGPPSWTPSPVRADRGVGAPTEGQRPLLRPRAPIERTLEVLRGPFRPLILWALFWGARPFSELMRHVPEVTKKALRRELADMERLGLVRREVREGSNRRAEYSLSPLGETLRPVVGAMYEWGLLCLQPRRSQERIRARSGA